MPSRGKTSFAKLPQWVLTDKPVMKDFNEAFANTDTALADLDRSIEAVHAGKVEGVNLMGGGVSVYVHPDGDDSGAGTAAAPFKTLGRALKACARYVNGTVIVALANGTYTELQECALMNYSPLIQIKPQDTDNPAVSIRVERLNIRGCSVIIDRVSLVGPNSGESNTIVAHMGANLLMQNCTLTGAGGQSVGLHLDSSIARVVDCEINNFHNALRAVSAATLYVVNNTGAGNNVALSANAARIYNIGSYPGATIKTQVYNGGEITGAN